MKALFLFSFLYLMCSVAYSDIVTSGIDYEHNGQTLQGFFAYDDSVEGKRPGILVIHEWWGHGDYVRSRAKQLARAGYIAFALDMYGKGLYADDHEKAAELSGLYRKDRSLMRERAAEGLNQLKDHDLTDGSKLAAIGYCFGGTTVLEMARAGLDISGVVSFHGGLGTPLPASPGNIKAEILVFNGAEDQFISKQEIEAFWDEMTNAEAVWQFVSLGGAVHSFTVPSAGDDKSTGVAYNANADRRSWRMMRLFLNDLFK